MSSGVQTIASGIVDGLQVPASVVVSMNLRVLTQTGPIGLVTDVITFSSPTVVGNWLIGAVQTQVMGMPVINQTSTGIGYSSVGVPTGPVTVRIVDSKVLMR